MPDVNNMSFNQLATVLNAIHNQATGQSAVAPVDTYTFVSQAQTALRTGYDPVLNAISQVLSRTIFSIRPYSAKFRGLQADAARYGNHIRKINYGDRAWVEDDRIKLVDGQSIDQQKVRKGSVLQTNFYGQNVYEDYYTIFRDQLNSAFSGPEEFQRFISGTVQHASDMLEQSREELARMVLSNYIGAKIVTTSNLIEPSSSVVHLLTEYNTLTGLSLTSTTVYQPENFRPFMAWVYSRVAELCSLMTERSKLFHVDPAPSGTPANIMRHTPYDMQRVYLYAPMQYATEARALADTYHDTYLRYADHETVNFWQSILSRDAVQVNPNYMLSDGTYGYTTQTIEQDSIFGVIVDFETLGWTPIEQWQAPAPFNAAGGYTTVWIHETQRYWTDMTENGIILLLD